MNTLQGKVAQAIKKKLKMGYSFQEPCKIECVRGGCFFYIFVFTDFENSRLKRKLNNREHEYIDEKSLLIDLARTRNLILTHQSHLAQNAIT